MPLIILQASSIESVWFDVSLHQNFVVVLTVFSQVIHHF